MLPITYIRLPLKRVSLKLYSNTSLLTSRAPRARSTTSTANSFNAILSRFSPVITSTLTISGLFLSRLYLTTGCVALFTGRFQKMAPGSE